MRSTRWALIQSDWYPYKKRRLGPRETRVHMPRVGPTTWRDRKKAVCKPRGGLRKQPADTLAPDFQTKLDKLDFCCWSHLVYGILSWRPKWIHIVAQGKKSFIELLKSGGLLTDTPRNSDKAQHWPLHWPLHWALGVIQGLPALSTVRRHLPLIKDRLWSCFQAFLILWWESARPGTSLVVRWLRLKLPNRGPGFNPWPGN